MNVEIGTEAAQFFFWEYINGIFVAVLFLKRAQKNREIYIAPTVSKQCAVVINTNTCIASINVI